MSGYYTKLVIALIVVFASSMFAPRLVNWILVLVLIGMLIVQADKYSALIASLARL